jgi:hypothetical protein
MLFTSGSIFSITTRLLSVFAWQHMQKSITICYANMTLF